MFQMEFRKFHWISGELHGGFRDVLEVFLDVSRRFRKFQRSLLGCTYYAQAIFTSSLKAFLLHSVRYVELRHFVDASTLVARKYFFRSIIIIAKEMLRSTTNNGKGLRLVISAETIAMVIRNTTRYTQYLGGRL